MKTSIREFARRVHPLHRLRKNRAFRAMTRRFDPVVRCCSPLLRAPIYLRLFANASLIADPLGQESSIRDTFIAIVKALPSSAGPFWDIGANVGLFTWYCATARPDIAIVSFEPDRRNLECLRRTQRAWQLEAHEIIPSAVADRTGRARFSVDDISGATGTLEEGGASFNAVQYGSVPSAIEVETVTLDSMVTEGRAVPSLIKIDVEQAELRVLRGGERLLREGHPILLLEAFGDRVSTFAFLREREYELFDSDHRCFIAPESVNILALPPNLDRNVADALAVLGYPLTGPHFP